MLIALVAQVRTNRADVDSNAIGCDARTLGIEPVQSHVRAVTSSEQNANGRT